MRITVAMVGVLVVIVGVVWAYYWWWDRNLASVEASYQEGVAALVAQENISAAGYDLKYKAKLIGQLLENRYEYGKSFQKVWKLTSELVEIEESKMVAEGVFEVKLSIKTVEAMADFEDRVRKINNGGSEDYSSIDFKLVEVNNGLWTIVVEVRLK